MEPTTHAYLIGLVSGLILAALATSIAVEIHRWRRR